jgi:hypothetical protein
MKSYNELNMIMDLSKVSTKDLENELTKRKTIPQPKDTIDWKPVLNKAIAIRNDIANDKWDDDYLNQLYDSVISSIFGPTYFTWEEKQDVFKRRKP